MANELKIKLGVSGLTITADTYLGGAISTSGIAMTEIGLTGEYQGDMVGLAGVYEVLFLSSGSIVGAGWIGWDGLAEVTTAPIVNTQSPPNALDIIKSAMRIIRVLGQNEEPSSSEAQDGLTALNDMVDSFSLDRTFIYTIKQQSFALVNGQASYTFGNGGSISITPPRKIDNAFMRIGSVDYPLKSINNQDYDGIAYKNNGSFPQAYYYDESFPLATLTLYGVPTSGTLIFDSWSTLSRFDNLTTQYTFPIGYYRFLRFALAQELASMYGATMTPEALKVLNDATAAIKDQNLPAPIMKSEVGMMLRSYRVSRTGW